MITWLSVRATTPTGNTKSMREKLLCCFAPCQNEDQVWSDRKEALCSFRRQNITAVNISKSIRFNRIGSIRIRWEHSIIHICSCLLQIRRHLDSLATVQQSYFWSRGDVRAWHGQQRRDRGVEQLLLQQEWRNSLLGSVHNSREELGATRGSHSWRWLDAAQISQWKTEALLPLWQSDCRQPDSQVDAFIQSNVIWNNFISYQILFSNILVSAIFATNTAPQKSTYLSTRFHWEPCVEWEFNWRKTHESMSDKRFKLIKQHHPETINQISNCECCLVSLFIFR